MCIRDRFRSIYDGSKIRWTPESNMAVQEALGADIAMQLDQCTPYPACLLYTSHMISGGEIFEQHTMADFVEYLFESEAKQHGAEFVYEMPAVQLVQDDAGKVTGAICQNKDEMCIRDSCATASAWCSGWHTTRPRSWAPSCAALRRSSGWT